MRKYKLHKGNKEELRDEDIEEYKDFGKLAANYNEVLQGIHKKPLYKNPKMFFALVLIVLVAWLLSTDFDAENDAPNPPPQDSVEVVAQ